MNFTYPELPSIEWLNTEGAIIERLVIHCWAEWNGYDIEMHKRLMLVQKQLSPKEIHIRSLNIDDETFGPLLKEHGFRGVPTLIIFAKGMHLRTFVGVQGAEDAIIKAFTPEA